VYRAINFSVNYSYFCCDFISIRRWRRKSVKHGGHNQQLEIIDSIFLTAPHPDTGDILATIGRTRDFEIAGRRWNVKLVTIRPVD
jgi:hypothetical protein